MQEGEGRVLLCRRRREELLGLRPGRFARSRSVFRMQKIQTLGVIREDIRTV